MSVTTVSLGDIAESIVDGPFGSSLKTSDYVEEGIPVLQGKNITGDHFVWKEVRYISEAKAKELFRSNVKLGDHLVIKIGSIGYSAIVDKLDGHDFAIIPANLARIRPNRTIVDDRYLHHCLVSEDVKRYFQSVASSTAQPALSLTKIKDCKIPLPPLNEQKRIAAILDKADQLRQKRRQAIALLDSLAQSIFSEMFGNKSPRTEIKIVPFDEVTTRITYGFTQPMSHHASGIPILTAKNIQFGYIDYENVKYTNEADFASLTAKSKPQTGDILITKDGTIGRSAVLNRDERVCVNQSVCVVKIKKDAVHPLYILHYLLSSGVQSRIDSMKKGNSIPHLQITELAKFPIPLPSNALQLEFINRLSSIESARKAAAEAQYKSESLFCSLQHRAFAGQL